MGSNYQVVNNMAVKPLTVLEFLLKVMILNSRMTQVNQVEATKKLQKAKLKLITSKKPTEPGKTTYT